MTPLGNVGNGAVYNKRPGRTYEHFKEPLSLIPFTSSVPCVKSHSLKSRI